MVHHTNIQLYEYSVQFSTMFRIGTEQHKTYGFILSNNDVSVILKYFENNERKEWHHFPVGMGCMIFAHHDGTLANQPIYYIFMHSDDWGQYEVAGGDTKLIALAEFIPEDYVCADECSIMEVFLSGKRRKTRQQSKIIKCPTCRTKSLWQQSDMITRFQLPEGVGAPKCIICQENDVSVMLKNCGHCTLCRSCVLRM